ncbi:MAG: hypothetical protein ACKN9V_09840 [Pseudomonadota bacterium]
MKRLWILIPILLVWILSDSSEVRSSFVKPPQKIKNEVRETKPVQPDQVIEAKGWGIQEYHQAQLESFDSPLGKTLVYSFSQDGIPILGMNIRLKEQPDGSLIEEENTYRPISRVPMNRVALEQQAAKLKESQGRFDLTGVSTDSLVIIVREGMQEGELSFTTSAFDKMGAGGLTQLVIRSDDGKILQKSFGRKEF